MPLFIFRYIFSLSSLSEIYVSLTNFRFFVFNVHSWFTFLVLRYYLSDNYVHSIILSAFLYSFHFFTFLLQPHLPSTEFTVKPSIRPTPFFRFTFFYFLISSFFLEQFICDPNLSHYVTSTYTNNVFSFFLMRISHHYSFIIYFYVSPVLSFTSYTLT